MVVIFVKDATNQEDGKLTYEMGVDVAKWENFLVVKDEAKQVIAGVEMNLVHSWEIKE